MYGQNCVTRTGLPIVISIAPPSCDIHVILIVWNDLYMLSVTPMCYRMVKEGMQHKFLLVVMSI